MFSLSFVFTSFRVIANIFLLLQWLFFGDQIFKTLEQVLLYKHLTHNYADIPPLINILTHVSYQTHVTLAEECDQTQTEHCCCIFPVFASFFKKLF